MRAYDCLLKKGKSGDIYDVSSGKSHSLGEIINIFRKTTDIPFQTKLDNQSAIVNHVDLHPLSLIELGWQPIIPLETTIKDTVNFIVNREMILIDNLEKEKMVTLLIILLSILIKSLVGD